MKKIKSVIALIICIISVAGCAPKTTPDGYVLPDNTYWKMVVGSDQAITFETVGNTDDFYDRYGWTGYRLDIEASDDEYTLYNIPEFRTV